MALTNTKLLVMAIEHLRNGDPFRALEALDQFTNLNEYELSNRAVYDEVERINEKEYAAAVDKAVSGVIADWRSGSFPDKHLLREAIHEASAVYGARFAVVVLQHYRGPADFDPGQYDWNGGVPWCELATDCLRSEIYEGLKDANIDPEADPPQEEVEKCAVCSEWKPAATMQAFTCAECVGQ